MPDGGDDKKGVLSTPVTVALIGLAGVLATAFIQNWDKLFRHQEVAVAKGQAAVPSDHTGASVPASGAAEAGSAENAIPPKTADDTGLSVAGKWHDTDGYSFIIRQDGETISYQQFHQGRANGDATGTLKGRDLRYRFKTTGENADTGTCMATLAEDGQHISGKCTSDGGGPDWTFTITRA